MKEWPRSRCAQSVLRSPTAGQTLGSPWHTGSGGSRSASRRSWFRCPARTGLTRLPPANGASTGSRSRSRSGRKSSPPTAPSGSKAPTPGGCNLVTMLASDADRDRFLALLREAYAAGRITVDELSDRVTRTLTARTVEDLDAVVADLQPPRLRARSSPPGYW